MDTEDLVSKLSAITLPDDELPEAPKFASFISMLAMFTSSAGILVGALMSASSTMVTKDAHTDTSLVGLALLIIVGLAILLAIAICVYSWYVGRALDKRTSLRQTSRRMALYVVDSWRQHGKDALSSCKIKTIAAGCETTLSDEKVARIILLLATSGLTPESVPDVGLKQLSSGPHTVQPTLPASGNGLADLTVVPSTASSPGNILAPTGKRQEST